MTADPFHIDLPLPPSVNALYRNVPGRGRVKTALYKRWHAVAVTVRRCMSIASGECRVTVKPAIVAMEAA